MKTNVKELMTILAALVVVCGSAQAVLITNGATTVFGDNFESYVAPSSPPPSPWVVSGLNSTAQVSDAISPGAYEGSNYLNLRQNGGLVGASVGFASQTSGTVKLTFMANTAIDSGYTGSAGFKIKDAADNGFQINFVGKDGFWMGSPGVYSYDGAFKKLDGLSWTNDVWKTVEFEYTFGNPTASLTVDGVTVTGLNPIGTFSSLSQLDYFLYSDYSTTLNIDAVVPEPATMILLGLGGIGFLRRRKA